VSSRHRDRSESTRVPGDIADAARAALPAGKSIHAFLAACLVALARDRDGMLALIEGAWLAKPKGRPPGKAAPKRAEPEASTSVRSVAQPEWKPYPKAEQVKKPRR
jgi:hypothetical protein